MLNYNFHINILSLPNHQNLFILSPYPIKIFSSCIHKYILHDSLKLIFYSYVSIFLLSFPLLFTPPFFQPNASPNFSLTVYPFFQKSKRYFYYFFSIPHFSAPQIIQSQSPPVFLSPNFYAYLFYIRWKSVICVIP